MGVLGNHDWGGWSFAKGQGSGFRQLCQRETVSYAQSTLIAKRLGSIHRLHLA